MGEGQCGRGWSMFGNASFEASCGREIPATCNCSERGELHRMRPHTRSMRLKKRLRQLGVAVLPVDLKTPVQATGGDAEAPSTGRMILVCYVPNGKGEGVSNPIPPLADPSPDSRPPASSLAETEMSNQVSRSPIPAGRMPFAQALVHLPVRSTDMSVHDPLVALRCSKAVPFEPPAFTSLIPRTGA
jgi:hypothetical protein